MSKSTKEPSDALFEVFDRLLKDSARNYQTEKQLIFDVVAEYIFELMKLGNVPFSQLSLLEDYLHEEVVEIYRKKTYGYSSLHEYQTQKLKLNARGPLLTPRKTSLNSRTKSGLKSNKSRKST